MRREPDTSRAWTIGWVNYLCEPYVRWQLKGLYEVIPAAMFKLVIADTSRPTRREALERLIEPYAGKYGNIEMLYVTKDIDVVGHGGGLDHGLAVDAIVGRVDTPFFLLHDPDFFWLKRDYLDALEGRLRAGYVAVGAPYRYKVGVGKPDFPAAFGCAYDASAISGIAFSPIPPAEGRVRSWMLYPKSEGYREYAFDVGFRVRETLSDRPYVSFSQKPADWSSTFGSYSFATDPREYFLDGHVIACHLFRGSFQRNPKSTDDVDERRVALWNENRDRYGRFFYERLVGSDE
jgi:hypothetical protein